MAMFVADGNKANDEKGVRAHQYPFLCFVRNKLYITLCGVSLNFLATLYNTNEYKPYKKRKANVKKSANFYLNLASLARPPLGSSETEDRAGANEKTARGQLDREREQARARGKEGETSAPSGGRAKLVLAGNQLGRLFSISFALLIRLHVGSGPGAATALVNVLQSSGLSAHVYNLFVSGGLPGGHHTPRHVHYRMQHISISVDADSVIF
ncbi:hypothetical protein J6590_014609 [Homalodisca vitripennis]|nr:hypothetical protein J6590_014609 [Homalodisca vitripennis]